MSQGRYNAALSKGHGLIDETLTILDVWNPEMSVEELSTRILREGILGKASATRTKDIVNRVFVPRYLADGGLPASFMLELKKRDVEKSAITQVMLIHTAREHAILADFISEVYWNRYAGGSETIGRTDAVDFISGAHADGRIDPPWSDSTRARLARYLLTTLADFGYLEETRGDARRILPMRPSLETVMYLAYERHIVGGMAEEGILVSPDWKLFGLKREDVLMLLTKVAGRGHLIVQNAGDLVRITWIYTTMEEVADAFAGR